MRGKCKTQRTNGEKRTITKFALFPICTIELEWRWLEYVTIEQEFDCNYSNYDGWKSDWWKNLRFIDD